MIWRCFANVLVMCWGCFGYVLGICWWCFGDVLVMFRGCVGDCLGYALEMFWWCFGDVLCPPAPCTRPPARPRTRPPGRPHTRPPDQTKSILGVCPSKTCRIWTILCMHRDMIFILVHTKYGLNLTEPWWVNAGSTDKNIDQHLRFFNISILLWTGPDCSPGNVGIAIPKHKFRSLTAHAAHPRTTSGIRWGSTEMLWGHAGG